MLNKFYLYIIFSYLLKLFALPDTFALPDIKAGESQGRAPGQASDYTLQAPTLTVYVASMTRRFTKISGPPNKSGHQVFCPPLACLA